MANDPRQVTAALWRFVLNVNSLGVGSGPCAAAFSPRFARGERGAKP
jgi:hypothetical protein